MGVGGGKIWELGGKIWELGGKIWGLVGIGSVPCARVESLDIYT